MNFFAHGWRFLDQPYVLAGTAVPDWLSVIDRRIRARRKLAEPLIEDVDPRVAAVARGIVQHHIDDDRFHRSRSFAQLSWQFTAEIRDRLVHDDGLRPSFLGHILVELLLDASLIERHRSRLDAYYHALQIVHPEVVQSAVNRITARATTRIAPLIPRFVRERFLYDYLDDGRLLYRLNQVMWRVGLARLPDSLLEFLAAARQEVRQRAAELLAACA